MWLVATLLGWAEAAVPFVLPPGESAAEWAPALSMGGFAVGGAGGGAAVIVQVAGARWDVTVRDAAGGLHTFTVDRPRTPRAREDLVWLAQSLLLPSSSRLPAVPLPALPALPPEPPTRAPPRSPTGAQAPPSAAGGGEAAEPILIAGGLKVEPPTLAVAVGLRVDAAADGPPRLEVPAPPAGGGWKLQVALGASGEVRTGEIGAGGRLRTAFRGASGAELSFQVVGPARLTLDPAWGYVWSGLVGFGGGWSAPGRLRAGFEGGVGLNLRYLDYVPGAPTPGPENLLSFSPTPWLAPRLGVHLGGAAWLQLEVAAGVDLVALQVIQPSTGASVTLERTWLRPMLSLAWGHPP